MTSFTRRLIYNPRAGKKRSLFSLIMRTHLENIVECLERHELPVEVTPTQGPDDARRLAKEAADLGYDLVIVAGGDGTVGEAANGLIGSETKLAIIPIGTFMNVARMLAIPFSMEHAVAMIKIGRSAKIDVGCIVRESGEKLEEPYYFLESVGLGLEARMQQRILAWERGDYTGIWHAILDFIKAKREAFTLVTDQGERTVSTTFLSIANGPYMGPALMMHPESKLDDHKLTVTFIKSRRAELVRFLFSIFRTKKANRKDVETFKTKSLFLRSSHPIPLHADARVFGETPAQFMVIPRALHVICGFPKASESTLKKRSYISP